MKTYRYELHLWKNLSKEMCYRTEMDEKIKESFLKQRDYLESLNEEKLWELVHNTMDDVFDELMKLEREKKTKIEEFRIKYSYIGIDVDHNGLWEIWPDGIDGFYNKPFNEAI